MNCIYCFVNMAAWTEAKEEQLIFSFLPVAKKRSVIIKRLAYGDAIPVFFRWIIETGQEKAGRKKSDFTTA